jgi:hypothetical protein
LLRKLFKEEKEKSISKERPQDRHKMERDKQLGKSLEAFPQNHLTQSAGTVGNYFKFILTCKNLKE